MMMMIENLKGKKLEGALGDKVKILELVGE